MKKLILLLVALTLPILSQADPNPEDSTRVLWKQTHGEHGAMFVWTPVYFTADGNYVINTAYYQGLVSPHINAIQKRSVETGDIVKEVDVGTPSRFSDLQLTPDGQYLIVAKNAYFSIQIRDANTLELIREIEIPHRGFSDDAPFKWITGINSARLIPGKNILAINVGLIRENHNTGNTILFYDFTSGEYLEEIIVNGREHHMDHIRINSDSKYLFAYPDGLTDSLYIINLESKKVVRSHEFMTKTLEDFSLSPDGMKYMYSSNISPNIYIYETYGSPFPKRIDY